MSFPIAKARLEPPRKRKKTRLRKHNRLGTRSLPSHLPQLKLQSPKLRTPKPAVCALNPHPNLDHAPALEPIGLATPMSSGSCVFGSPESIACFVALMPSVMLAVGNIDYV